MKLNSKYESHTLQHFCLMHAHLRLLCLGELITLPLNNVHAEAETPIHWPPDVKG